MDERKVQICPQYCGHTLSRLYEEREDIQPRWWRAACYGRGQEAKTENRSRRFLGGW